MVPRARSGRGTWQRAPRATTPRWSATSLACWWTSSTPSATRGRPARVGLATTAGRRKCRAALTGRDRRGRRTSARTGVAAREFRTSGQQHEAGFTALLQPQNGAVGVRLGGPALTELAADAHIPEKQGVSVEIRPPVLVEHREAERIRSRARLRVPYSSGVCSSGVSRTSDSGYEVSFGRRSLHPDRTVPALATAPPLTGLASSAQARACDQVPPRHSWTVVGVLAHRLGMELTSEGLEGYSRARRGRHVGPTTVIVNDRRYRGPATKLALRARRDEHLGRIAHLLIGSGRGRHAPAA
jgi:hypothetical protein